MLTMLIFWLGGGRAVFPPCRRTLINLYAASDYTFWKAEVKTLHIFRGECSL